MLTVSGTATYGVGMPDVGCRDAACRMPDAGCQMLDAGLVYAGLVYSRTGVFPDWGIPGLVNSRIMTNYRFSAVFMDYSCLTA